jgi:hypothetical protein
MSLRRLRTIIESYGADTARWPEEERSAMTVLLAGSDEARNLLKAAARLDEQLDQFALQDDSLRDERQARAILAGIRQTNVTVQPLHWSERLAIWLFPQGNLLHLLLRPALAAGMPLLIGLLLGIAFPGGTELSASEELALLAMTESTDTEWFYEQ